MIRKAGDWSLSKPNVLIWFFLLFSILTIAHCNFFVQKTCELPISLTDLCDCENALHNKER